MYVLLHNNKSGLYAVFICNDQNDQSKILSIYLNGGITKHYFYIEQLNVYSK